MKVTPKYALYLPQRHVAAAPEDPAAGHHGRGQPGHALERTPAQRRNDPTGADGSGYRLRRIPRGAGRRNARLPAGAAGGRGRRLQEQRQGLLGRAQALRPDRALPAADRPAAPNPPYEHRALDPQLQAGDGSARRQGQAAGRRGSRPRTPCSKSSPNRTRTSSARCVCCPARSARPNRVSARSPRRSTCSDRRSRSCTRSPARWRPRRRPRGPTSKRQRRSSRTRSAHSRARSCRRSMRSSPTRRSWPKRSRSWRPASRC